MVDLHTRLARLPLWSGPISVMPLPGGMTNRNLMIEAPEGRFVARIAGNNAAHDIDRAAEQAATRAAAQMGIGPELVWAEPDLMILRHIAGHTLGKSNLSDEATLLKVIALLRNTHRDLSLHYEGQAPDRSPLAILHRYTTRLQNSPGHWRGSMEHHQRLLSALVPLLAPVPSGFTHNDVHGDNLIDDGERVWLVDWEYAGQGQPLADIASLANNALMTEETAEAALRQWLDRPVLKSDRAAFAAMRLATALRDLFWGYAQDTFAERPQTGLAEYIAINEARVKAAAARL